MAWAQIRKDWLSLAYHLSKLSIDTAWLKHIPRATHMGLLFALHGAQIQKSPQVPLISKQPQPSLTEHMEMRHNWGRFNPNTKPPAQAKGNEVSDREIFPKILSDQPSAMQSDLNCHRSQADRGQWGWDSTEREQNDLLECSPSTALEVRPALVFSCLFLQGCTEPNIQRKHAQKRETKKRLKPQLKNRGFPMLAPAGITVLSRTVNYNDAK